MSKIITNKNLLILDKKKYKKIGRHNSNEIDVVSFIMECLKASLV